MLGPCAAALCRSADDGRAGGVDGGAHPAALSSGAGRGRSRSARPMRASTRPVRACARPDRCGAPGSRANRDAEVAPRRRGAVSDQSVDGAATLRRRWPARDRQQPGRESAARRRGCRKNWLFAGSFEGARRAALLYSLVQSCKLIDIPPFDYLKDVLLRVATHPQRLIGQLTPKGWASTFRRQAAAYAFTAPSRGTR
jgi:transposase IS66-like protein